MNPLDLSLRRRRRLPVVLQSEAAECGLACLAMVASFWGHRLDLAALRRRFAVSLKGSTLRSLIDIATALKLTPRPLKLPLDKLSQLPTPCVLHWDMNHFVVLKCATPAELLVHDPAVGQRRLTLKDASQHFTGVALELVPASDFVRRDERIRVSIRSLMGQVSGLPSGLARLAALGVALQVCALVAPFNLQWVVDEALVSGDRDLLVVLAVGFGLLAVLQSAISWARTWFTSTLAASLNFQWLSNAFGHLLRLPIPFFEKRHLGDVISRFGSIEAIQKTVTTQFVEAVIDGMLVGATLVAMALYSVPLALVSTAAVALYAALRGFLFPALQGATSEQIIHAAKQQTQLLETARGIQCIRLSNRADERRISWSNALADQLNAELRVARLGVSHATANHLLFGIERTLVIWLGARLTLDGQFSVGMLLAFLSYKDTFAQRFAALIDKIIDLRMLRLHAQRVADILYAEADDGLKQGDPAGPDAFSSSVEFKGVAFRYADAEPWVLKELSFRIPEGQCVAIVGASGSGKTTLIKLLLGLLKPEQGTVLVGGHPVANLHGGWYRDQLAAVLQEDQLFSGSIFENISFFDSESSHARVVTAARQAAVLEEIVRMPMGFNTLVGDLGTGLSGGQKQRILLARALYRRPKLLILDEATSHLDVWNERLVNAAIRQTQVTRVIVAHRAETIAMADRVLFLEGGVVARDLHQTAGHEAMSNPQGAQSS